MTEKGNYASTRPVGPCPGGVAATEGEVAVEGGEEKRSPQASAAINTLQQCTLPEEQDGRAAPEHMGLQPVRS